MTSFQNREITLIGSHPHTTSARCKRRRERPEAVQRGRRDARFPSCFRIRYLAVYVKPRIGGDCRVAIHPEPWAKFTDSVLDLGETRFKSHIPTLFSRRFPANSHALTSVEGLGD